MITILSIMMIIILIVMMMIVIVIFILIRFYIACISLVVFVFLSLYNNSNRYFIIAII